MTRKETLHHTFQSGGAQTGFDLTAALNLPVSRLKGVGPRMADKLTRLGITSQLDLLFHLPMRYQDRTHLCPIGGLWPGREVLIEGEIVQCEVQFGRRRSLICRLRDSSGIIGLRFYHFNAAQQQQLALGTRLRCYGEARHGASGYEIYHPEYRLLAEHEASSLDDTLTPVYPTTEGVSQQSLRKLISQVLPLLEKNALPDWLPVTMVPTFCQVPLAQALQYLHHPPNNAPVDQLFEGSHPFQQRLVYEELLSHHIALLRLRHRIQQQRAPAMRANLQQQRSFMTSLAFTLTNAQQRVLSDISHDLQQQHPMLRLVQGDVGSGKTVVAALAALQVISQGYQAAIMAPTEILAEQHLQSFQQWFAPLDIRVDWLTGRIKGKARKKTLEQLQSGHIHCLIGTHALFQSEVSYHKLGLIIVDEQHRFGVHQRLALREKGLSGQLSPHQLIMTATPIPRTLAMTAYADLDLSIIDELPPGRTAVNTVLIDGSRRSQLIQRVRKACIEGRQTYWVCTLIEESEALQCQAAQATAELLHNELPELRIALVHGRLKAAEKAATMAAFHQGEVDLLVATTVIEVGVNVPNASLMIIENPERLGLAQLHQLRGRIGRGSIASHCVLLYSNPLSQQGKERLTIMRDTNDGFVIAEKDLQLRGPGEVLGSRQTGIMQFKIADLERDQHLLEAIKPAAEQLITHYPDSVQPLLDRWIGNADYFANA